MAQLTINYTATSDIKAYSYNGSTWAVNNIDQALSTWDSTTHEGVLVFNEGVNNIADSTFRYCSALLTLKLNNGWTRLGTSTLNWDFIFANCVNLTSVILPDTLTFLGGSTFSRCEALNDIDLGNGLERIGQYCFDFTAFTSINFPASLREISSSAFIGASNIDTVICKATTPPTLGSSNFVNLNDTLYVPGSSKAAYQASSAWSSVFSEIKSIAEHNEIVYNATSDLKAYSYNGGTWCITNIDQNASTWDSITGDGILVLNQGVTSIGVFAFGNCTDLISISFGEDITLIDQTAFANCTNLTDIGIPATTTSIAKGYNLSFKNCQKLEYISIDDNNTVYSSHRNCIIEKATNNLILGCKNTVIPNTVVSIDDYAFNSQKGVTEIYIPEGVTSIGAYAFTGCTNLTNVLLPSTLSNIGNLCFNNCNAITSFVCVGSTPPTLSANQVFPSSIYSTATLYVLPSYITDYQNSNWSNYFSTITEYNTIHYKASSDIKAAKTWLVNNVNQSASTWDSTTQEGILVLNYGVTSIGSQAFYNLGSLIEIDIHNSITSISNSAFTACYNLTTVTLHNGLTSIASDAFYNCSRLTSITIPATVTSIAENSFRGTNTLASITVDSNNTVYDSRDNCNAIIETATNKMIIGCKNSTIPNTVVSLGEWSFQGTSITSVNLPASVTSIHSRAFYSTTSITSITVDSNNQYYNDGNGQNCIIETATNTLILGTRYTTIPNTVEVIGHMAFQSKGLTSINIPVSVREIGNQVFDGNSNLASITVDSNNQYFNDNNGNNLLIETATNTLVLGVNTERVNIPEGIEIIKGHAFFNYNKLNNIILPSTLTTIGSTAIWSDSSLITVICKATTPPTLGPNNFSASSDTLYVDVNSIDAYKATNWKNVFTTITAFPSITYKATEDLKAYSTWLQNNVDQTYSTYNSSSHIGQLMITVSIDTIGASAFENCTAISEIEFNRDFVEIEDNAFNGCSNLLEVTCKATTPPILGDNNFTAENDTLYTSFNLIPVYEANTAWRNAFTNITYNNLIIDYVATSDLRSWTSSQTTWVRDNVDQNASTWDSTTHEGKLVFNLSTDTVIPNYAFNTCTALQSFKLGKGWTGIGTNSTSQFSWTFAYCSNLVRAEFSDTVKYAGISTFSNDNALEYLWLGNGFETMNSYQECGSIQEITLPASMLTIQAQSFTCHGTGLPKVICKATTPPSLSSGNFDNPNDTLYVYPDYISTYSSNTSWRNAFTNIKGIYTVTTSAGENGSIDPDGSTELLEGQNITINITPDAGYRISSVVYDGLDIGTIDNFTITNIDANHTLEASFEQITYQFSTDCSDGGSIEPYGITEVVEGDTFSFSVTPDEHYRILDVTIDGVSMGAIEGYTFEDVHEGHIIYATFEHITHTITATAFEGGAIVPSGAITVNEGENQSFDIVPLEGYGILAVFIDGTQIEPVETYTFTDVEEDHTIDVMFYPLRVAGFNREQMLDLNYLLQTYIEQLRKKRV